MKTGQAREVRALRRHLRCLRQQQKTLEQAIMLLEGTQRAHAVRVAVRASRSGRSLAPKAAH